MALSHIGTVFLPAQFCSILHTWTVVGFGEMMDSEALVWGDGLERRGRQESQSGDGRNGMLMGGELRQQQVSMWRICTGCECAAWLFPGGGKP